jgi:hypothetical protein
LRRHCAIVDADYRLKAGLQCFLTDRRCVERERRELCVKLGDDG